MPNADYSKGSQQEMDFTTVPLADKQLKTLQIIRFAVLAGPLTFMVIALLMKQNPLILKLEFVEVLGIVFAASALVGCLFIDKSMIPKDKGTWRAMSNLECTNRFGAAVMTKEILKAALLEGSTLFLFLLILIDKSLSGLIMGLLLIGISVATFPTRSRFLSKLESLKFQIGL